MSDDATIIADVQPVPAAEPVQPVPAIPGNPAQTQATVKRFKDNPAEADYVFGQLGYDQTAKQALDLARKNELRSTTFEAALKYGIPEDKLHLIADATSEGIMRRAADIGPLLKTAPTAATPDTGITSDATPPAKSAGVPLPAVQVPDRVPSSEREIANDLTAHFAANPLPK